ncbi:tetratricopeptide repeat protein [bacterium SCSIO 12741]|nr:tetratricopeptide repeat protein [bacterium SCSIO 12741]
MRKLVIAVMLLSSTAIYAQKSKVTSTNNYLNYNELDDAKEAIDAATSHPTTTDWWKTYFYRGRVYFAIATSQDPKYASMKGDAVVESASAYEKALTYEDKKMDKDEIKREYARLANTAFDAGIQSYNAQDWANSLKYFQISEKVGTASGVVDSGVLFNIVLVAMKAGQNDVALEYLDKNIEKGYKGAVPYQNKATILLGNADTTGALEVLKMGREKFPSDQGLITQELNIYLVSGRLEEALGNLDAAIANDPTNYLFFFARGTIYDKNGDSEKAVADYTKATELNPQHFDSYYNIGALYYNQGANLITEANNVPPSDQKKYEELKNAGLDKLKLAMPALEMAHQLDPKNTDTMVSLKTTYTYLGNTEKAIEIQKKIDSM